MNSEQSRINTFTNWPTSAEVEPTRIAKAGFYYTGQGLEVQCFSCGGKISEWNYGDQVMVRHRRLDPSCPFVVNPLSSGNVPLVSGGECIQPSNTSENEEQSIFISPSAAGNDYGVTEEDELYRNDALRLLSFIHWPVSFISRESLASAGFYHAGEGRVRCAWCGGQLAGGWRLGDLPLEEHRRHFPQCVFVAGAQPMPPMGSPPGLTEMRLISVPDVIDDPPPPTEIAAFNERVLVNRWRGLGFVPGGAEAARFPALSSLQDRLTTFTNWPTARTQTPQDLAEAGFYHVGSDDQVQCFYCGGGLNKWEPGDTPWMEHAHWFPLCGYVLLVKGREFIERCRQRGNGPRYTLEEALMERRRHSIMNRVNFPVSQSEVDEAMESAPALAALGAGLDAARVRRAIISRIRITGHSFRSAEVLIDTALDDQLNEEPWGDTSESDTPQGQVMARHLLEGAMRDLARRPMLLWNQGNSQEGSLSPADSVRNLSSPPPPSPPPTIEDTEEVPAPTEQAREEEDPQPSDDSSSPSQPPLSLEEENRQLKEARLCKVCMDNEVSVVFLPCGHLLSCGACGSSLSVCPLCRANVRALVRAYLA